MTRLFIVLGLVGALLSIAIFEQLHISQTFGYMKRETSAILSAIKEIPPPEKKEDYKSPEIAKTKIDELHRFWTEKEGKLCVLLRHMELSYISDALVYARNFVHFDNQEESCAGLERLKYLLDTYSKVYGMNGWNIL